VGTIWRTCRG